MQALKSDNPQIVLTPPLVSWVIQELADPSVKWGVLRMADIGDIL